MCAFFRGSTRLEVVAAIARCQSDTDQVQQVLIAYIQDKQRKNKGLDYVEEKLKAIEQTYMNDTSLHPAFRDARVRTGLSPFNISPEPHTHAPSMRTSVSTTSSQSHQSWAQPVSQPEPHRPPPIQIVPEHRANAHVYDTYQSLHSASPPAPTTASVPTGSIPPSTQPPRTRRSLPVPPGQISASSYTGVTQAWYTPGDRRFSEPLWMQGSTFSPKVHHESGNWKYTVERLDTHHRLEHSDSTSSSSSTGDGYVVDIREDLEDATRAFHLRIGEDLEVAMRELALSSVVRREIMKCVLGEPGYERGRWGTVLGECGLDPESVVYMRSEMEREVAYR